MAFSSSSPTDTKVMQAPEPLTFFCCLEDLHRSRPLLKLRLSYPVVPLRKRRSLDEVLPLSLVRLGIHWQALFWCPPHSITSSMTLEMPLLALRCQGLLCLVSLLLCAVV